MDERLADLSKYRLEQAEQCIRSAKLLAENDDTKERQTDHTMRFFIA